MRLKHLVVTTACIAIFLGTANAQSWSSNTYGLYVNPTTGTTGNVGIGIASTNSNKVTIKANTTTQPGLRIYNSAGSTKLLQSANGGLSVGTATAAATDGLLVQGASKLIGEVTLSNGLTVGGNTTINGAVTMKNTATVYNGLTVNVGTSIYNFIRFTGANGRSAISAYGYHNWDALDFSAREYIFNSGNVGIGVSAPQAKLHVGGKILCTGEIEVAESLKAKEIETKDIKVEINNAADYVFDENYNLKSLSEVESFVNANKHLPGVPSAAEMAQNGVSVSEMSNLLLEKVEELTLHMIQLEKENKALKAEVELLKK